MRALATLAGGSSHAEADALLSIVATPERGKIISWLGSLYDGPGTLNPLRPDRLGEALVAQALRDREDLLGRILSVGSVDQLTRCFDVLARVSVYNTVAKHATAAAVAPYRQSLALRAEAQSRGRLGQPGRLALANSLIRLIAAIPDTLLAGDAVRSGNATQQRNLAIFYTRLADLAIDTGQGDQAQDLYQRALAICQDLADGDPGSTTCQRDLSVSYDRLARLARDVGQGARARDLYQRPSPSMRCWLPPTPAALCTGMACRSPTSVSVTSPGDRRYPPGARPAPARPGHPVRPHHHRARQHHLPPRPDDPRDSRAGLAVPQRRQFTRIRSVVAGLQHG